MQLKEIKYISEKNITSLEKIIKDKMDESTETDRWEPFGNLVVGKDEYIQAMAHIVFGPVDGSQV